MGDLAAKTPMRTDDQWRIGSITKTMTASIVLQLVDEGRVGLDDPVATIVPEVPNGSAITVRQLLNMTSGLFSYTADEEFNREADAHPDKVWTSAEPCSPPPSATRRAGPGTTVCLLQHQLQELLGVIAEELTGQDLPRLFERLFDRSGMTHSNLPAPTDARLPRPYAHGYDFVTLTELDRLEEATAAGNTEAKVTVSPGAMPADVTTFNPSFASAAGAVISTAEDMKIWAKDMPLGRCSSPTHSVSAWTSRQGPTDSAWGRLSGSRGAQWCRARLSKRCDPCPGQAGEHHRTDQSAGSTQCSFHRGPSSHCLGQAHQGTALPVSIPQG